MTIFLLVLGLALFIVLVIVHEYGHFVAARRNGVVVDEFGLGFPPRAWSKKMKSGFIFSLNWLPLGGFVRLKGEHDSDTEKGSYGAASLWVKTKIMVAGVFMNLLAAFVIFTFLALVGLPQLVGNQFSVKKDAKNISQATTVVQAGTVEKNSPAASAGIKTGDTLLAIGTPGHLQNIRSSDNLPNLTKQYAGQTVEVRYQHGSNVITSTATLRTTAQANIQKGYLGIGPDDVYTKLTMNRYTWSAPVVAAGVMGQYTGLTFKGLGTALKGLGSTIAGFVTSNTSARQAGQHEASAQVAGPVGIYFLLKNGTALGYRFILTIIGVVSLTLAIMNFLPIPALDGGRLFVTLVSHLFRKRLKQTTEELIHGTGFALLMVLFVLITIVDVKRNF